MVGHTPLDIAHQYSHHNVVSLLWKAKAGLHYDQESLSGSVESGYTTSGLSTDHSLVEDSDIAQISDLEDDNLPEECHGINTIKNIFFCTLRYVALLSPLFYFSKLYE